MPLFASATIASTSSLSSTPIAAITRITVMGMVMAHISSAPVAGVVAFGLSRSLKAEKASVMNALLMIGILAIA